MVVRLGAARERERESENWCARVGEVGRQKQAQCSWS